ncbi:tubulin-specific chaperone D [Geosmithia morbida]|uniref:Tubulin-specific chaperone D n=1 Tax=Geosmithia morbida TaxID=1094350 RepID=A0A9P5D8C2_9HYPO|nr:tubulin-specific chaperone D [Geosmithia morbida]KAF4126635.1 tubulin-specific chaperone D [Geosmithia morbida]
MDAPEEFDIKLQKISADLIADFDRFLPTFLRKADGNGGSRVYSRVRSRDLDWATGTCLDPFQELPQLLDAHLTRWIPFLSNAFLDHTLARHRDRRQQRQQQYGVQGDGQASSISSKHLVSVEHAICKMLYTFCKIRGEKVIVHFLNVEAKYLEVLLRAIEEAEEGSIGTGSVSPWSWEQRYVVLLWLSHLMLAPFDLSTISSVDLDQAAAPAVPGLKLQDNLPSITLRAVPLAIKYIASPGKERDGAKALLVRIAMRRDMQQAGVLSSLIQWSLAALRPKPNAAPEDAYHYLGVLSFLAGILRSSSDTSDANEFLRPIFDTVHGIAVRGQEGEDEAVRSIMSFALTRKMILKVIRFVTVSLLRDDDGTDITETAIGYLLESLSDTDTPVRLAASKSLSIITLKLDPEMASQVVEAVLESLNRNVIWKKTSADSKPIRDLATVDPTEWHGLILTLSHLLYRRSPPADQLSDIIHALLLGLSFEKRGVTGASVGSNVRDAACFGIWALARRYTTAELLAVPTHSVYAAKAHPAASSILQVLATELTTTASLDSAGNIRRGASAALQELIGRHPDTVDKGIWVVQTVDYHAVARRSRAMEEVALGSAKLSSQYGEAMIDGVLGWRGIGDADAASRRDAATAFGRLTAQLAASDVQGVLPRFRSSVHLVAGEIDGLQKRQVEERHGLLLCFAAILDQYPSLTQQSGAAGGSREMTRGIIGTATAILRDCKTTTYRRPELVVEAASRLVASMLPILQQEVVGHSSTDPLQTLAHLLPSTSGRTQGYLPLVSVLDAGQRKPEIDEFLSALHEVIPRWLSRSEADAIEAASAAALILVLFSAEPERSSILAGWAATVETKPTSRKGTAGDGYVYTLAMAQPLVGTGGVGEDDVACRALNRRWAVDDEVDTRVAILQALTRSRLLRDKPLVFLGVLSDGLNDYTTTARGDVGSHVRVQALKAVATLWGDDMRSKGEWVGESVRALFYSTLRLSAEKLDRIRPEAQIAVSLVLDKEHTTAFRSTSFSSKAYFRALLDLVHSGDGGELESSVAELASTDTDGWMASLLSGLVTSADTGNEDLVVASRAALADFCDDGETKANLELVCRALLGNVKTRQGQDRVVVPTLEVIAFLFHAGLFQQCDGEAVSLRSLCLQTQKAGYKTGNMRKIDACIKVYGGIAAAAAATEATDKLDPTAAGIREARKRLGALLSHPWPKVRVSVVDQLWALESAAAGDDRSQVLMGVDWAMADKSQIRSAVQQLQLE